ncbi:MAG: hypothetical protein GAK43_00442 [Stenotrophomonas maltophilia]|nr:MAG: hypothetical protein GAK43_00442 [Stenotrophomonas maltophilia]
MVRTLLTAALIATALPAWADPAPQPLQIRLTVVEGCPAGAAACTVPRQQAEAAALPAQLRELAPPPATDGTPVAHAPPTTIY